MVACNSFSGKMIGIDVVQHYCPDIGGQTRDQDFQSVWTKRHCPAFEMYQERYIAWAFCSETGQMSLYFPHRMFFQTRIHKICMSTAIKLRKPASEIKKICKIA